MNSSERSWKASVLNKGQFMSFESGPMTMTVEHVDRAVDQYLAGVTFKGQIVYTGLHSTLADARSTCEEKANFYRRGAE